MANVLHRTIGLNHPYQKKYKTSVNTGEYSPAEWIINPDLSAVQGFNTIYWNINGNSVTLADQATRDARDTEILAGQTLAKRDAEKERFDNEDVLRAVVRLLVDEINILRVAAGLQPRTAAQARTAIRNAIDGGV